MKSLLENFTRQLEDAIKIGSSAKFTKAINPISNVVIAGMGGSGIAATIVSEIVLPESKFPVFVSKEYGIPAYVSKNSLVIISSYSGNTEETIEAMEHAIKRKANIVCIASGGKILEMAKKKKIDCIVIPAGMPPRACVGYSLTQIFFTLSYFKIISPKFKNDIKASISLLNKEEKNIKKEALKIAKLLLGKIPVIYSPAGSEGVSVRFRQNLNENSKVLAWHNVIPEMNHNEILGWARKETGLALIFFRSKSDDPRVKRRIDITKKIISKYISNIIDIYSKGNSVIEKTMYQIHIGDWISVLLADLKKVDAIDIRVIEYLKGELKKPIK